MQDSNAGSDLKDSGVKETNTPAIRNASAIGNASAIASALTNTKIASGKRGGNKTFTAIAMMAAAKSDGARARAESSLKKAQSENRKLLGEVFLYRTERDNLRKKVEHLEKENERLYAAIAEMQNESDDVDMGSISS